MEWGTALRGAWLPDAQHTRALISLIQWSQGGVVLDAALKELVTAFGAECGVVSRVWLGKTAHRIAARAEAGEKRNLRPLFLSYVNDALGTFNNKPKVGSIFSFKEDGKDPSEVSPILQDWMAQRRVDDILFVCLDNQGSEIDLLELHFRKDSQPNWREGVEALAPELTKIFTQRRPGLIVEAISRQTVSPLRRPVSSAPILSTENPTGLTRAEWRVCVLISRGLSAQAIGEELGIGRATVRTHLKHIYSKTGMESFHMLARQLVSVKEREALHGKDRQAQA